MRLHGLVFAAGQGTPPVGVSYDPKVRAFMDYMGIDRCIDLADVTEEGLRVLIDRAMAAGGGELNVIVDRLRELEGINSQTAKKLLEI